MQIHLTSYEVQPYRDINLLISLNVIFSVFYSVVIFGPLDLVNGSSWVSFIFLINALNVFCYGYLQAGIA